MPTPRIQTVFSTPSTQTMSIAAAVVVLLGVLFGTLLLPMPARTKL